MYKIKTILSTFRQSLKSEEQDYTQGSIPKAVVLLSIPMILELAIPAAEVLIALMTWHYFKKGKWKEIKL